MTLEKEYVSSNNFVEINLNSYKRLYKQQICVDDVFLLTPK